MPRITLRLYVEPGSAEVFLSVRLKNGGYARFAAVVDTGAAVCLFPRDLLDQFEYRTAESSEVHIEQAGIAMQTFSAVEALITVFLEDLSGARTSEHEIRAWFANTETILIGFD